MFFLYNLAEVKNMKTLKLLQILKSLGGEFWLPLPFLGLAFWTGTALVTDQVLSYSYGTTQQLQADKGLATVQIDVKVTVLSIEVEINRERGFAEVEVKTSDSALKELKFEFLETDFIKLETAISEELQLPPAQIKQLVRYRIDD